MTTTTQEPSSGLSTERGYMHDDGDGWRFRDGSRVRVALQRNNTSERCGCALCGDADWRVPCGIIATVAEVDRFAPICDECGDLVDPALMSLVRELAERAV